MNEKTIAVTKIKVKPFGYFLGLDLYDCKPGACDDLELCYKFLDKIPGFLGVTKQSPPFIFHSPAEDFPDKAGLSGWVPLIESGIQIHTLTPKNFISVDVYSCAEFDVEKVIEFAKRFFHPKSVEANFLHRGIKYHKESK